MTTLRIFKSYSFRDKDPVIDRLRTLIADGKVSYEWIEAESGVSRATLYNWFRGPTMRPQFATVMAVARSLGYDLQIVRSRAHLTVAASGGRRTATVVMPKLRVVGGR